MVGNTYFVRNRKIALSREKLLCEVWGYDFFGDDNSLEFVADTEPEDNDVPNIVDFNNSFVSDASQVEIVEEEGITLEVPDNNTILVKGADKQKVGAVAAEIKALRPIEPYHGYGIHYTSEPVILKPGKSAGKKK